MEKLKKMLSLIDGYLYSASSSGNILTPFGHNPFINEYLRNHRAEIGEEIQELPELSDIGYQLYGLETRKYLLEIDNKLEISN